MAIDAYLGISLPEESSIVSQDHYATKLKKRLQAADRNKANYDLKVRAATLDEGDRVLIRQLAFKGRHKISGNWNKDPYVVIDIPIAGIPVFTIQKVSDSAVIKTLHRNLLLPFSAIPRTDQVEGILPS